jgi:hypothetical protein
MKRMVSSVLLILLISTGVYAGKDKTTLKEKVEKNKPVKIFFSVREIIDQDDEDKLKQTNPKAKTDIRTVMPEAYYSSEIKSQVVKSLNDGMQVGSAFVEGNISTLPASSNKKTNFRDLSKLPDGFYAIIDIAGEYRRVGKTVPGNQENGYKPILEKVTNRLEIKAQLFFYEIADGKIKKYGDMLMKTGVLLATCGAAGKETKEYKSAKELESVYPTLSYLDMYKKTMLEYTNDFAARKLKKHNKVVSKRK